MRPESQTEAVHRHEVHAVKEPGDSSCLLEGEELVEGAQEDATKAGGPPTSNKKTDETLVPPMPSSRGYLWRISSGIIGTTTGAVSGAVGLGVSGVKWAASKGYTAGSMVVDTTKAVAGKVPVPTWKAKDKKE